MGSFKQITKPKHCHGFLAFQNFTNYFFLMTQFLPSLKYSEESTLAVIRNTTNAVMCYLAIIITAFLCKSIKQTKPSSTQHCLGSSKSRAGYRTGPAGGPGQRDAADRRLRQQRRLSGRWRWPCTGRRSAAHPPYLLRWHCISAP